MPALQIPPALSAVDTAALRAAARAAQRARSNCFSRKATERLNDYCGATREMWNSNFYEYILSEDSLPHNQNVKLYTVYLIDPLNFVQYISNKKLCIMTHFTWNNTKRSTKTKLDFPQTCIDLCLYLKIPGSHGSWCPPLGWHGEELCNLPHHSQNIKLILAGWQCCQRCGGAPWSFWNLLGSKLRKTNWGMKINKWLRKWFDQNYHQLIIGYKSSINWIWTK